MIPSLTFSGVLNSLQQQEQEGLGGETFGVSAFHSAKFDQALDYCRRSKRSPPVSIK